MLYIHAFTSLCMCRYINIVIISDHNNYFHNVLILIFIALFLAGYFSAATCDKYHILIFLFTIQFSNFVNLLTPFAKSIICLIFAFVITYQIIGNSLALPPIIVLIVMIITSAIIIL